MKAVMPMLAKPTPHPSRQFSTSRKPCCTIAVQSPRPKPGCAFDFLTSSNAGLYDTGQLTVPHLVICTLAAFGTKTCYTPVSPGYCFASATGSKKLLSSMRSMPVHRRSQKYRMTTLGTKHGLPTRSISLLISSLLCGSLATCRVSISNIGA